MSRLPQPGKDAGTWGDILNDYLSQAHTADGSLKDGVVGPAQIQDGTVTTSHLDPATQASLDKASSALQASDTAVAATASKVVQRTTDGRIKAAPGTEDDDALIRGQVSSVVKDADGDVLSALSVAERNAGNIGQRILGGRMGTLNLASPTTFHHAVELSGDFDAVQIIIANSSQNLSARFVAGSVSVSSSAGDLNNSDGQWSALTRGGSSNWVSKIAQGGTATRTAYTLTDWVPLKSLSRIDGGTKRLLFIRLYTASNSSLSVLGDGNDNLTNWATHPDSIWVMRSQTGDAVSTPSSFTSIANISQSPIVGVRYLSRGRVINVGAVGDSITEGRGTYICEGFGLPACNLAAEKLGVTVEYSNFGWSGQASSVYYQRGIELLASEVRPDILLIPAGSPNDYPGLITDSLTASSTQRVQSLIAASLEVKTVPIVWTWTPCDTSVHSWGTTDALRVALNDSFLSMNSVLVADAASAVSTTSSNGQIQIGAYSNDGIHPNDAGNTAIANVISNKIASAAKRIAMPTGRVSRTAGRYTLISSSASLAGGGLWTYAGSTQASWVLCPADPATPEDLFYILQVRPSAKAVVLTRSGTNQFLLGESPTTSITVWPGETVTLWWDGTYWTVSTMLAASPKKKVSVSSSASVAIGQSAEVYIATGASATYTLPSIAIATGQSCTLVNRGTGSVTISASASELIWSSGSTVSSITVSAGSSRNLLNDGVYWLAL